MQTQKLVYEGPDPERLLLDVWNEHGTDALISEPERFVKGGVGGFFAKTYYRVEVEPQQTSNPAPETTKTAPVGTMAALESMIEDTEDVYEDSTAMKPSPKATFDEVLAGVASSLGEDPTTFARRNIGGIDTASPRPDVTAFLGRTPQPEPGPLRIFPPLGHVTSPTGSTPTSESQGTLPDASSAWHLASEPIDAASIVRGEPVEESFANFDSINLDNGVTSLNAKDAAPSIDETTPLSSPSRIIQAPQAASMPPVFPTFSIPSGMSTAASSSSMPTRADVVAPEISGVNSAERRDLEDPIFELRQAGFPAHLLALIESRGLHDFALENAFALLPPTPSLPRLAGSLIAVVGIAEHSLPIAERIATSLEVNHDELALASVEPPTVGAQQWSARCFAGRSFAPDLLVHDASAASTLSPGWRRDRVGIVTVALEDEVDQRSWGRAMLRAIRPTLTIAVVDARSKGEDLAAFAAGVGGVDALAVRGASQTISPAALLALGLPVLYLDGSDATGEAWANAVRAASSRRES